MTVDFLVGFAKEAIKMSLLLSAPMLSFGLVVGLLVSIFQAVTQVQEMTLTFVPKIVAVICASEIGIGLSTVSTFPGSFRNSLLCAK